MQHITSTSTHSWKSTPRLPKGFQLLDESAPSVSEDAVTRALSPLLAQTIPYSTSATEQRATLQERLRSLAVAVDSRPWETEQEKEFQDRIVMRLLEEAESLKVFEHGLHRNTIYPSTTSRKAA